MPKELMTFEKFDLGIISAIDSQDIPKDANIYSENLDSNVIGKLQGIPISTLKSSTIGEDAIGINNWLRRETGEYDLIYTDNTNIKSVRDFYGTPSENTEISSKVPTSMVRLNRGLHIGVGSGSTNIPQYMGWGGDFNPFGGIGLSSFAGTGINLTLFSGLYTGASDAIYYIKITSAGTPDQFQWKKDSGSWSSSINITGSYAWQDIAEGLKIAFSATTGHVVNDIWQINVYASRAITLIKQDATLNTYEDTSFDATPDTGKFSIAASGTSIRIYAGHSADSSGSFDRRITGVNVYRSDDSTPYHRWKYSLVYDGIQESLLSTKYFESSSSFNEDEAGQYKLVKSILIANGDEWIYASGANAAYGYVEVDDVTASYTLFPTGVSYEQNSGLQENAEASLPNYELGCSLNNSHFVAKCYVPKIPDAKMILFKSTEFCYDVFDIYNDKCFLNIIPTAIAGINNKIYVWDSNTTIVIDAGTMAIETVTKGVGCSSNLSWTIIDTIIENKPFKALVFADVNDIYMDDGSGARPISGFIRKKVNSSSIDWQSMQHTNVNPILAYDSVKNILLCVSSVNYAGNIASVLAFNISHRRWDYYPDFCNYSNTSYLCKSVIVGKNGETYSTTGSQMLSNFAGATNRAWKYYSPELIFDAPKQPKKFYNLYIDKVETSGTITPTYSVNKGSSYGSLTNTTEIKTGGAWEKQNSIILALAGTAGVNYVNSMELLYRKMVGVR